MKKAHLLVFKHWIEGQRPAEYSGDQDWYMPPSCSPSATSRVTVSPGEELLHTTGGLDFVATAQRTPLDCLILEARGVCTVF